MVFIILSLLVIILGFIIGRKKGIGILMIIIGLLMMPISLIVPLILIPLGLIAVFVIPR